MRSLNIDRLLPANKSCCQITSNYIFVLFQLVRKYRAMKKKKENPARVAAVVSAPNHKIVIVQCTSIFFS